MKLTAFLVIIFILVCLACSEEDLYKILGVSKRATQKEIKYAYKNLAKEWHPDKSKHPSANEKFMKINEAYETLGDPEKRSNYDNFGETTSQPRRGPDDWNSFPGGFPFQFRNFHGSDMSKHRLNLWTYENKVLPDSYTKPTMIYAFTEFCFQCFQVAPVWEQVVQDLEKIGMGIGTLNANLESQLSHKLKLRSVPAILGIVNGKVRWFSKPFTVQYLRDFIRDLVPSNLVTEVQAKNLPDFLSGWTDNRVRMLFFDTRKRPCLRYLLTAFAFRDRVCAGFVNTAWMPRNLLTEYKISPSQENLLIFKENIKVPAAQISMHSISRSTMSEVIESNQFLILPRLSCQTMFDHLCPPQSTIRSKRLCVLLLSEDIPQHEESRETFRQYAQEQASLTDRVRFAYVYEDSQADFVQSLTFGKGVVNDSLGTLKVAVVWRKSSKSIQYDYLEDGWHASGKGLEESRHHLTSMVEWLLASSDILPFSLDLPNELIDEHAQNLWGQLLQRLFDWYDWIFDRIVSSEDVTLVTLVTAVIVVVIIACISRSVATVDDDSGERQRRRTHQPGAQQQQQQQERQGRRTMAPGASPSHQTRSTREIVRLTGENYDKLVVDAQSRNVTLVLLVEEQSKKDLLRDFKLMISPAERLQPGTTCAYLDLDEQHKMWYLKLLRSTSMLNVEDIDSYYAQANGTVLAVYGQKRYYWIFHGKRNTARTSENQRRGGVGGGGGGAEFLGMDKSGSDNSDNSDCETLHRHQPTVIGLLRDLDTWLDRFYEGTIPKYKVSDWPAFD